MLGEVVRDDEAEATLVRAEPPDDLLTHRRQADRVRAATDQLVVLEEVLDGLGEVVALFGADAELVHQLA